MSAEHVEAASPPFFRNALHTVISSLREIPLVSKGIIAALFLFYTLSFIPLLRELLVLKPVKYV
jgi:hypothetical protein